MYKYMKNKFSCRYKVQKRIELERSDSRYRKRGADDPEDGVTERSGDRTECKGPMVENLTSYGQLTDSEARLSIQRQPEERQRGRAAVS